ncbi:MAG: WG repeat-containing protein [Erysipelotrichaceae bacterium]|nr:WG repeat-containing protein [Erysipelotrichaceae bacterium]
MRKLLLIILCALLVCGCASDQGGVDPSDTTEQEEDLYEYNEENLYIESGVSSYGYKSFELEYNEEMKPLLEKIAIGITKKHILHSYNNQYDENDLERCEFKVYYEFDQFNDLKHIIINYTIESLNDNSVNSDTVWVNYYNDSYVNSRLSIPVTIDSNVTNGDIIPIYSFDGGVITNYYEFRNNELHEMEYRSSNENNIHLANIFEDVIKYHINEDVASEIKDVILSDPKVQYYMRVNNFTDIRIGYDNIFEVYADNEVTPFLRMWQTYLGEFNAEYDYKYTYNFTYTKDNEIRNATLYFQDSYGGYNSGVHPKYSLVKLIANKQEFNFYYRDGNLTADYVTPMIFTEDLHTKVLNYFKEYLSIAYVQDYTLSVKIGKMIREKGTKYTFTPIKMGESIDDRLDEIDSIEPLVSRQCDDGNTYTLTPYYQVEIGNLYGLVDEDHELVLPIVNSAPILVWYNRDMFNIPNDMPNNTIYTIAGGYGGGFDLYMTDNTHVYIDNYGDDGPNIITKKESFNSDHTSIPVELITVTDYVKSQAIADYYEYVYDTRGYGLMNGEGHVLTTEVYDGIANVLNDYVYVHRDGLYGFLNTKGEEIIPLMYEDAMYVYNEQAIVMKDGKYGAITMNNDVIVEFKYDKLSYFGKNCYVGLYNDTWEIIYI